MSFKKLLLASETKPFISSGLVLGLAHAFIRNISLGPSRPFCNHNGSCGLKVRPIVPPLLPFTGLMYLDVWSSLDRISPKAISMARFRSSTSCASFIISSNPTGHRLITSAFTVAHKRFKNVFSNTSSTSPGTGAEKISQRFRYSATVVSCLMDRNLDIRFPSWEG